MLISGVCQDKRAVQTIDKAHFPLKYAPLQTHFTLEETDTCVKYSFDLKSKCSS